MSESGFLIYRINTLGKVEFVDVLPRAAGAEQVIARETGIH